MPKDSVQKRLHNANSVTYISGAASGGAIVLPVGVAYLNVAQTWTARQTFGTQLLAAADIYNAGAVLTLPTTTDTLIGRDTTDTLTNKTLTNPTINAATLSGSLAGTPTFSSTITFTVAPVFSAMTAGSVLFAGGSGTLAQDNANLYWDDANNRLSIGVGGAGSVPLHVLRTTEQLRLAYDGSNYASFTVTSGGDLNISPTGSDIGINTNPSAALHVLKTTEQLRLGYDASNYASFTVTSGGDLNISPTGSDIGINTNPSAALHVLKTAEQLRLAYDGSNYASFTVTSGGDLNISPTGSDIGINTNPSAALHVLRTTEQLRLAYDGSNYTSFTVTNAGVLDIDTTGGMVRINSGDHLQISNYASQTTGWRISNIGEADFRYLYVDEMHAKAFIADLEQALAGGQIITKSVAKIAANFTLPTAGNSGTLVVEELAGFTGAVFQNSDIIRLRQISRGADTSLTIADAWGTVTYLSRDGSANPPTQSYTFTRSNNPNAGSASGTISLGTLALDYGTSSGGYYEVSAVDGAYGLNAPYAQTNTWSTHPAAGVTTRTRLGNLRGITGSTEFGLYAGDGTGVTNRMVRLSDQAFELRNIDAKVYDGSTLAIELNRTTPYLSIGSPVPSSYLGATGIWMGKHSSVYKMHLGTVSGGALTRGFTWDGTNLNVKGNVVIGDSAINYGVNVGEALFCAHFDGPRPHEIDFTGNANGHRGQVATMTGGVIFRPGKFGKAIQVAEAVTNRIQNPSIETNTTGYGASATLSRSSEQSIFGTYSLKWVWSSGTTDVFNNVSGTLANSTQYTFSVYVKRADGAAVVPDGSTYQMYIDSTGSTITPTAYSVGNGWYRLVGTRTTGGSANNVLGLNLIPTSTNHYFDGWQCEQRSYATPYCDGSLGTGHSWSGTAHASTSSRTAATLQYPSSGNALGKQGTVSGWIFLDSKPEAGGGFVFQLGNANTDLDCFVSQAGILILRVNNISVTHGTTVTSNVWHHVVCVWDIGANSHNVYLDGVAASAGTPGSTIPTLNTNIGIGYNIPAAGYPLNGCVDDLCILPVVLSAAEIKAIYDSNAPVVAEASIGEIRLTGANTGYVWGNANGLFGVDVNGVAQWGMTTSALNANTWGNNQSESLVTGAVMLGSNASGYANILWDPTAKQLKFRGGTTTKWYVDTNGNLTNSGATLTINENGLGIVIGTTQAYSVSWLDGASVASLIYGNSNAGLSRTTLDLVANYHNSRPGLITLSSFGASSSRYYLEVDNANSRVKTNGTLLVDGVGDFTNNGVRTKSSAGAPGWSGGDGEIAIDTTNNRAYFKVSGTWKYANLT